MQNVNPKQMEMIRSREKRGFWFVNRSVLAEKAGAAPALSELSALYESGFWNSGAIGNFVCSHNGRPAPVQTYLKVVYDDSAIFFGFCMKEPDMKNVRCLITAQGMREIKEWDGPPGKFSRHPPIAYGIEKDENIELVLDATHDHRRYLRFFINMAGVHCASEQEYSCSQPVYPEEYFNDAWKKPYDAASVARSDCWLAAFKIPWVSLGVYLANTVLLGMNARRSRTPVEWQHHTLAFAPDLPHNALDFADLYLDADHIELCEANFGFPFLGAQNTAVLKVKNSSKARADISLLAEMRNKENKLLSTCNASASVSAGKTAAIKIQYHVDWHDSDAQTLSLVFKNAVSGVLLGTHYYRVGYYGKDVAAEHPYGKKPLAPDPAPTDPDFLEKKRLYLVSRIPKFKRANTAGGAPSDFTLVSQDGKYKFNLMQRGVLKKIAAMVEKLFAAPNDRLAALCLLAHQNSFSLHMAPHVALHNQITALSALRLNAGHCYSRALVWQGIAKHLRLCKREKPLGSRAHMMLVLGHVIGAVDIPGTNDRYLFDPTLGTYYYNRGNTAFATEKEIEKDIFLADRVVCDRTHNFVHMHYHACIPPGQIVYPQGAVAE